MKSKTPKTAQFGDRLIKLQGLFILGWGVMGAYCLSDWIHNKKINTTLWSWCAMAGVICFVNPYHINGVLFPFYLFARLNRNSGFKEHVSELISPFEVQSSITLTTNPIGASSSLD
ncbi:MAG: hypothetical protein ACUVRP_05790 [Chlorobiales bacterium]